MNGCSSCGVQSGASYQYSPLSTSIFPSLLTSATATPSERNFRSRTVFFQVIWWPGGAGGAAGESGDASPANAAEARARIGNRRNIGEAPRGAGVGGG